VTTDEFVLKLQLVRGSDTEASLLAEQELVAAYDSLQRLVGADILWPLPAREAAQGVFGGGIHNPRGRVHKSLDRRIQHALRVWRSRYGLNPAQLAYAGDVLGWAISKGASGLAADDQRRYPFVLKQLERIVNDEKVHEGFKRRSEYTVAVDDQIKGLIAEATATPFD